MATIVQTAPSPTLLYKAVTETTLNGAADTFTFARGTGQVLVLRNPTGASIGVVRIVGSTATTWTVPGALPVDVSTGFSLGSIAAGQSRMIQLDLIYGYLQGTITITGGTGLIASLFDGG